MLACSILTTMAMPFYLPDCLAMYVQIVSTTSIKAFERLRNEFVSFSTIKVGFTTMDPDAAKANRKPNGPVPCCRVPSVSLIATECERERAVRGAT
ncbi:hypothetical protein B0T16DRAFT_203887 [Cercophora newfieldiana]|uniref:Secreted protein n=1 Tax=Cercophora newfieldiana TaxID=92897 RepID=A0AA39XVJ0_9PEZI|nr:hypothetical protein B0T16DRAFT_203887 [Cercophora newfieldiana]